MKITIETEKDRNKMQGNKRKKNFEEIRRRIANYVFYQSLI